MRTRIWAVMLAAIAASSFCFPSIAGGWQLTNGPYLIQISTISASPSNPDELLVAGWGGGIYQSTNRGLSYQKVSDANISDTDKIFHHPGDPSLVFAGNQWSHDGGRTWSYLNDNSHFSTYAVAPDNPDLIYAMGESRDGNQDWVEVKVSTDRGNSFQPRADFAHTARRVQPAYICSDPGDNNVLYSIVGESFPDGVVGRLYKSTDSGFTWGEITGPEDQSLAVAGDPVSGSNLLVLSPGGLYRSPDHGVSWQKILNVYGGWFFAFSEIAFDPGGGGDVWLKTGSEIWHSSDRGSTWSQVSVPWSQVNGGSSISPVFAQPGWLYASNGESVFLTQNGGASWQSAGAPQVPAKTWHIAVDPINSNRVYAGQCCNGPVFSTTDGGGTWTRSLDKGVNSISIHPSDPTHVYLAGNSWVYESTDVGQTWNALGDFRQQTGVMVSEFVTTFSFSPDNPQTIYIGAGGYDFYDAGDPGSWGRVFVSHDGGANWQVVPFSVPNWAILGVAAKAGDPNTMIVATSNVGIYRTTDGGGTWMQVSTENFGGGRHRLAPRMQVDPLSNLIVVVGQKVLITEDFGATWQDRTPRSSQGWGFWGNSALILHPTPESTRLLVAYDSPDGGIFVSENRGRNWSSTNTIAGDRIVALASATDGTLYATTEQSGVIKGHLGPVVVAPNGGENWTTGTLQNIRWLTDLSVGSVRIEYSPDNGSSWQEVASSTEDDGVYAWTVPTDGTSAGLIRVSDAADRNTVDASDGMFSLVQPPPPLSPGEIRTIAGNGIPGFSGDGGLATQASLRDPWGIAVDAAGILYIADWHNNRIRRIGLDGVITTVAGNGTEGYSADGGLAIDAEIYGPNGVAVGGDGSLYVTEPGRIRRIDAAGIITTVAGRLPMGFSGDGGPAVEASLTGPPGLVAVGADGVVYIADAWNHRVRRVGTDGLITTIAGTGEAGYSGDGGPATQAMLNTPNGIGVDADGNVFVADWSNHCIRRVGSNGIITTVAGTGVSGYSGDGSPATQAQLAGPKNLAVGADGSVYIVDSDNHRIRRIGTDGIILTIAGSGIDGYAGDGGPAVQARLSGPTGVAVDASGYVYVVDYGNNRIRKVAPGGNLTDPVVTQVDVRSQHWPGQYDVMASAWVADPQGLGTIASVVLQMPDGTVYRELLDNGQQCDGGPGDGQYGWCGGGSTPRPTTPLPLGMYKVVVTDGNGNVVEVGDEVERFVELPTGFAPAEGSAVGGAVSFTWSPVLEAATYGIGVWTDQGHVWGMGGLTGTVVGYNADSQGPALEGGRQYWWGPSARDAAGNESYGPGSRFVYVTDPDRPVVTQVEISGRHQDMDYYDVSGGATVADPQGLGTIASVVLQMPDGTPYAQLLDNGEECDGEAGDGRYGRCLGEPFVPSGTPLPVGMYRIVVTDADGNVAAAEDEVERFLDLPAGTSPTNGAAVGPTVEFRWEPVVAAVSYDVGVWSSDGSQVWRMNGLTSTSVQYNADGQGVPLEPGLQYSWAVWAWDGQRNESSNFGNQFFFYPYLAERTVDFSGDGVVDFGDFFPLANQFGTTVGATGFDPMFDVDHSGRVDSGDLFIFADNFGRSADTIVIPDPPGPGPGPYANAGAQFALDSPPVIAGIAPGESVEFTVSAAGLVGVQEAEIVVEVTPAEAFDLVMDGTDPGVSFTAPSGFISLALSEPSSATATFPSAGLRVALWSPSPVNGDLALGRFALRMSSSFDGSWQGTIRITRVSVGPNSVEQDVLSPSDLTVAVSYVPAVENPPAFSLPHSSQPPVLDGVREAGEWEGALRLECSPSQIVRDGEQYGWLDAAAQESRISVNELLQSEGESGGEARTDADVAAKIWQMWDEEALYFLAEVRDNAHDVEGTGNPMEWWARDGVALCLDLINSREQWRSDGYLYYQAKRNIVNYLAALQNSSSTTATWERLVGNASTPTQAPGDIAGLEYSYRYAGSEFGGQADYVIEGKIPWQTLLRHYTEVPVPQVGTQMGFSWLLVDPDGDDWWGGSLQAWGWANHPSTYATWVLSEAPPPPFRANRPNGGEEWEVGTDQIISWSADPAITAVQIEYSTDGGATWNAISASTENDGEYIWTVPMGPAPAVMVRVSDAADGDPSDTNDGVFAIIREPLFMTAYPAAAAPVLNGQIGPDEYGAAPPVFVEFSQPEMPPGIVPNWIAVPTDAADLSYSVYTVYTATDLYVAVEVTDDIFCNDSPEGWQDDDVELFIDGDRMANDMALDWMQANAEGFFVWIDKGGDVGGQNREFGVDWFANSSSEGGKRTAEFRIPLSAIDTQDGMGATAPTPGEIIGLNITVGDDDNGGEPYELPDDSYGAWTGSYDNWLFNRESDWGRLYFSTIPYLSLESPTAAGTNVETNLLDTGTENIVASLTFSQIAQEGETTLERTSAPTLPPSGFQLGDLPVVYELSTTAAYSGPIEVCLSYSGMGYDDEQALRLFHFEDGIWTNVTTRIELDADLIYGVVTSLSPFAIYELRPSVVDNIPPTISLNGANPLLVELGTPYPEPGAKASDLMDGNLTGKIQIIGTVDVSKEGSYTLTYSASDNAGNPASASRMVKVVTTPNSYGLIATHSLHLGQSSRVNSGFVGVVEQGQPPFLAGKVELVVGTRVQTAQDVRLSAPRVRVRQGANIDGELVYTQLVSVGKRATIAQPVQVAQSYWPLFQGFGMPAFQTGTPGTQNIEVRQKDSATLNAGAYGQVQVKQKGTLTFTGGTYQLGNLDVGPKAGIRFLAPTTLLIKGQLSLDQNSSFGPAPGSGISAAQILVYVEGVNSRPGNGDDDNEGDDEEDDAEGRQLRKSPRAAKIGVNANFQGNLYAPNGTIHLRQGSSLVGSFIGRDIILGVRAQVVAQSGWNTPGVIWQPQTPVSLTKLVGEQGEMALPAQTGLLANYPNPFNPSTTIPYTLAEAAQVKLSVYNVLGQQVRVLVAQLQASGVYAVDWDGLDGSGQQVAGGVYFYRLETGAQVAVGKMVLAR